MGLAKEHVQGTDIVTYLCMKETPMRLQTMSRRLLAGTLLLVGPVLSIEAAVPPTSPVPATVSKPQIAATMMGMPLQFEANHGQVDDQVKFLARGKGYTLFLTPTESVMVLQQREATGQKNALTGNLTALQEPAPIKQSVVRMKLEGANPSPIIDSMEPLPGIVNYFIGNDPAKWRTKIPTYAKVQYKEAYPGIDLAYYGNQGKLEYDFIVAPGADPNQIKLAFEGASEIKVAASGDLLLTTALGYVRLQKPIVYQVETDGHKTLVAGNYIASPQSLNAVQIQLAAYDHGKALVIDPVLDYATYLGGSSGDANPDIAADAAGNAYISGFTNSLNFPVTPGAFDSTFNAIFVAKVNPTGTTLLYATYLGGTGNDPGNNKIAVDAAGQAYVAGPTSSTDFPVTPGAFQTSLNCPAPPNCSLDGYVTKLNATGSALVYSTYIGGSGGDFLYGIAVDGSGNAYITGDFRSNNFMITPGAFSATTVGGFLAKINPAGTGLVWSTRLAVSSSALYIGRGVALDSFGNAIVIGQAQGTIAPLVNPAQSVPGGGADAAVWKFNPAGSVLLFSTYLGGTQLEQGFNVAVDSMNDIYVTGQTTSLNFPTTPGAFRTTNSGEYDIFVTKLSGAGAILYSTYLGGSGDDCFISSCDIGVDASGQAYISADTESSDFPVQNAIDSTYNGARDAVLSVFKEDGSGLTSSTFLGGPVQEGRVNLAVLPSGTAFLAGNTRVSFPVTPGVFQPIPGGGSDEIFIVRISNRPTANAGPDQSVPEGTLVTLDGTGSTGGSLTYNWTKVPGPPTVSLGGATTAHPSFAAPHVPAAGGTVTFDLIVCEGTSSNCSDPDTVNVHIVNVNHPPVAEAGPDQTVQEGSTVMLDGSASYDPDIEGLNYQWNQIGGPVVTLVNPNAATPFFSAPSVGPGGATIVFDLTVTDARTLTASDSISVFVTNVNQSPTANAGPDQTKNELTVVILDGSGSIDPDLDALNYTWTQTGGPSVILTGANTPSPTLTAPNVGAGGSLLTFRLIVNDGQTGSAPDTVQIVVQNVNDPPVCTLAQASPNLLWPPNHTMVPVSITGITDPSNQVITVTFTTVTQDESVNGLGDGDTSPDAAVSGNQILLRAERSGTGNGRVYVVQFNAANPDGASCSGTMKVAVPHSKKDQAVEGPQFYNSFAP
jgi:hypothetical protein